MSRQGRTAREETNNSLETLLGHSGSLQRVQEGAKESLSEIEELRETGMNPPCSAQSSDKEKTEKDREINKMQTWSSSQEPRNNKRKKRQRKIKNKADFFSFLLVSRLKEKHGILKRKLIASRGTQTVKDKILERINQGQIEPLTEKALTVATEKVSSFHLSFLVLFLLSSSSLILIF